MKLIFGEIVLILAIVSQTNSLAGRLHPTHTRTDTFSALKELVFGKFKKSGLTTFVKRLDGSGPILYKTYQRKPQAEATEGQQPGWRPNHNGNYDLLGIGWKKSGSNSESESRPTGGLAGLANRLKTKKLEIKNHLKDKFEQKKQVKQSIFGGVAQRPGAGSDEMALAPGSPEYERLKQYHLMGVVDMYRPKPDSSSDAAPGGNGWDTGESAPAPTKTKMKAKKKKKAKKTKKKKQKKVKKKVKKEKKKVKQQIKANKAAAAAAPGAGGWNPPGATILPAGSAAALLPITSRIPGLGGGGGRDVVGSIGSTVISTYKLKPRKKLNKKEPTPNPGIPTADRINSKLTRPDSTRKASSIRSELTTTALKTDVISSRLGLAASSAEDGLSYEEDDHEPFYSSYTAFYRVPNYQYSMF